jgi:hypothetical protein
MNNKALKSGADTREPELVKQRRRLRAGAGRVQVPAATARNIRSTHRRT